MFRKLTKIRPEPADHEARSVRRMGQTLSMLFLAAMALVWGSALLVSTFRARSGLWVLGIALFFASIGVGLNADKQPRPGWLLPVQTWRAELYAVVAASLAVPALIALARRSTRGIAPQTLLLILIGLYSGLLLGVHEGPSQAFTTVVLVLGTLIPMGVFANSVLRDEADYLACLRAVALANVVFIGVTLIQFGINPKYALAEAGVVERRFAGPTQNPQLAAVVLAVMAVVSLWLVLNDHRRTFKPVYIALVAADIALLLWTGSRTGAIITVIGATFVLYARAGRAVLFLPLVGLTALGAYEMISGLSADVDVARLLSTENTRSKAWEALFATGMQHPFTGVGLEESEASENSYLYAFSAYGVGMVVLTMLLTVVSGFQCLRLLVRRGAFDRTGRAVVDLVLGFNAMYFASAMVEGHMIGRVSPMIVFMVMFSAILSGMLLQSASPDAVYEPDYADEGEPEDAWALEAEPQH